MAFLQHYPTDLKMLVMLLSTIVETVNQVKLKS